MIAATRLARSLDSAFKNPRSVIVPETACLKGGDAAGNATADGIDHESIDEGGALAEVEDQRRCGFIAVVYSKTCRRRAFIDWAEFGVKCGARSQPLFIGKELQVAPPSGVRRYLREHQHGDVIDLPDSSRYMRLVSYNILST
ncbi:hypothetical protein EVAR_51233_1 [Eumeta japonica]|uniref:Uncharacterized protein n=1 Tax=Eumeta variegata TaxID=151549 RepID=A0A4C1X0X5_EUMVA|nr:hypothetical protein EVAR_51233_1 [Eumeta japonica]